MIRVLADDGSHRKFIRPEELSVYDSSPCARPRFELETAGRLEETLRAARLSVEPHTAWIPPLARRVSSAAQAVAAFSVATYEAVRDPPPTLFPRLGVIAGSGLAGLTLALRGPRWRRWLYPGGAMLVGASVCYPETAVSTAQSGAEKAVSVALAGVKWGASLWTAGPPKNTSTPAPPPATVNPSTKDKVETKVDIAQATVGFVADPQMSDPGQGNAGDRDLYTTRGHP